MQLQPYLFFDGKCDGALEFYKTAVGAKPTDALQGCAGQIDGHARHREQGDACAGRYRRCQSADVGRPLPGPAFQGFGLAVSAKTEAEAEKMFGALSAGGEVRMPMAKTFFSPKFGMVADKFGVLWMVMVGQ